MVEIFQNIRKHYDFETPCEELSLFVEFFSISCKPELEEELSAGPSIVKMFSSWTPTFYINLGSPYYIDLKETRHVVSANDDILILRNDDVTRHISVTDRIFTVKFYPGGLEAVLGISQVQFAGKVTNLNKILPAALLAKLKMAGTFKEQVVIMQSFLLAGLSKKTGDHYIQMVNNAIAEYNAAGMRLNTTQVAEKSFITPKTINRYFNNVVGVSPKSYFSILRARTALTEFVRDKNNFSFWDFGYYDQSHFRRDMLKFTGQKFSDHKG